MMGDSLYGPGWTGYPSISTTSAGTIATPPPQQAPPDQPQPTAGSMSGCLLCQHPAVRQGLFIVGVFFLFTAWHTHLKSVLE